jgi:hypothetical protein
MSWETTHFLSGLLEKLLSSVWTHTVVSENPKIIRFNRSALHSLLFFGFMVSTFAGPSSTGGGAQLDPVTVAGNN